MPAVPVDRAPHRPQRGDCEGGDGNRAELPAGARPVRREDAGLPAELRRVLEIRHRFDVSRKVRGSAGQLSERLIKPGSRKLHFRQAAQGERPGAGASSPVEQVHYTAAPERRVGL